LIKLNETIIAKWIEAAREHAAEIIGDRERLQELVRKATRMAPMLAGSATEDIKTLVSMVKAYASKQYTDVPRATILMAIGAILYLITPLDFIPDPFLLDDAVVIGWVVKRIMGDVERFRTWEQAVATVIVEEDDVVEEVVEPVLGIMAPADATGYHVGSFVMNESLLRDLLIRALPPKVRIGLRDVKIEVLPETLMATLITPVGRLQYELRLPLGQIHLASGTLEFELTNMTKNPLLKKMAEVIENWLTRKPKLGEMGVLRAGNHYTAIISEAVNKVGGMSLFGMPLLDCLAVQLKQEPGCARIEAYINLEPKVDEIAVD